MTGRFEKEELENDEEEGTTKRKKNTKPSFEHQQPAELVKHSLSSVVLVETGDVRMPIPTGKADQ